MDDFTVRGHARLVVIENQQYECDSWFSDIACPKSGDFPLSTERDTYWVKSITNAPFDPFAGFFGRQRHLAHEMITSNQVTMHIQALPTQGRPDHYTGAIGQFQVTGEANPATVAVGEPVRLHFTISGMGNFDYVRCPQLPEDPAWKTYVATSKTDFQDESHTRAVKTFDQSIVPKTNGNLQLGAAAFSYFDPSTKEYVTVPVALPAITVTGSPVPAASASTGDANDVTSSPVTPKSDDFLANRLEIGHPRLDLQPVYRHAWFWVAQGGLLGLPLLGGIFLFIRSRSKPDAGRIARERLHRSQQQEEESMAEAVRRNDPLTFFLSARHAVQLQLGSQWNLKPESITLGEIRRRDHSLADTLQPLFAQADEVIYSGRAATNIDLAHWERTVRELLALQPA
jgi:hypothetical protein